MLGAAQVHRPINHFTRGTGKRHNRGDVNLLREGTLLTPITWLAWEKSQSEKEVSTEEAASTNGSVWFYLQNH